MNYVTQHWSFDPFVIVLAVVVVLHETGVHRLTQHAEPGHKRTLRIHSLLFYAGLVMLVLAVNSPIDYFASRYFFVHMIEHILTMFFGPILIVLGAPWLPLIHAFPMKIRRASRRAFLLSAAAKPLRAVGRFVSHGTMAILFFNAVMVLWHLPSLLDLAENNAAVHVWLMDSSFFVAGVLFWLQIVPSDPIRPKLSTGRKILAIVMSNIVMFILAMSMSILTASSWYSVYNHVRGVSLAPFADQQIGAAILWVCGDFWAVPALVYVIHRAVREEGGGDNLLEMLFRHPATPELPRIPSS